MYLHISAKLQSTVFIVINSWTGYYCTWA